MSTSTPKTGQTAPRSRRAIPDLGVDWHLPARDGDGFAARRFASTTVASDLLITVLAAEGDGEGDGDVHGEGATWSQVAEAIRYDDEAKAVALAFVDAGHGDVPARTMLAAR